MQLGEWHHPAMRTVASILWRRLDSEGHDACRLEQGADAWQLDGAAVFRQADGCIAQLHYRVNADLNWHTRWGTVRGWLNAESVDLTIVRSEHGEWSLNARPVPMLAHCVDLDLGFTPATNLLALRRLGLAIGESAEAPAAWLDAELTGVSELGQRYARLTDSSYAYAAPRFDYHETLHTSNEGFVRLYPQLWLATTP